MGNTYTVPRKVKGESRILIIFSVYSLLSTIGGALIGALPALLVYSMGFQKIAIGIVIVCAAIGFGLVTLKIPDAAIMGKFRKAGGEIVGDILFRTLTFGRRKKIYLYREGGRKKWKKV